MAEASPQLGYITAESLAKVIISQPELRDCLIIDVRGDVSQEMRKGCNHLAIIDSSDSECCAASRVSVLVDELGCVCLQSQVLCMSLRRPSVLDMYILKNLYASSGAAPKLHKTKSVADHHSMITIQQ